MLGYSLECLLPGPSCFAFDTEKADAGHGHSKLGRRAGKAGVAPTCESCEACSSSSTLLFRVQRLIRCVSGEVQAAKDAYESKAARTARIATC